MMSDLNSGQLDFAIMVMCSTVPYLKSGELTAMGVTVAHREAAAPSVPALAENPQFAKLDVGMWFGLLGPRKLPLPFKTRLTTELRLLLKEPALRSSLTAAGLTTMEDVAFAPFLEGEIAKFKKVVELANIIE